MSTKQLNNERMKNGEQPSRVWDTTKRLCRQLNGQRVRLGIVGLSILIYIGLSIWNPMYSAIVIDHLWQSIQAAISQGIPFSITWENMGAELTQLSVQYFLTWIFYYLQSFLMASVAENLTLSLRKQVAEKLNRLPLRFFDQNKAGEILSRVTSDLDKVTEVLQTGLLKMIAAIGTVIGSLVVMFLYSIQLTGIFLLFMVVSMLITRIVARKNLKSAAERQETIGELTGIVEEFYNGRDVIKAYNHEHASIARVKEASAKNAAASQKADFLTNCVNPLIRLLTRLAHVVIAIVGSTGAGKTTLVNLLMRFYEVNGGVISIDGVSTSDMTRKGLRSNFGMVLQDTWLFEGTVAENIAYGKADASREEIIDAAKAAKVDYFIRTMPHGYDTVLDNEASVLSAGQRQLLTIARVFLCDPPILILDEATSSVDTRTETKIGKAMNQLMKGRTSFIIAHRLSTIRDADTILFMDHGNIIEQGSHEKLLKKNGAYAALYYSQFE